MRLRRDDEAVTEVLGFILSFALSAVFLMIALTSYYNARENSDEVVTAVELKTIADRVALRVVEAGLVSQEFPNSEVNIVIHIPPDLNGHLYEIEAAADAITVRTTDGALEATATTYRLDALADTTVSGTVTSSQKQVTISYSLQGSTKSITIH